MHNEESLPQSPTTGLDRFSTGQLLLGWLAIALLLLLGTVLTIEFSLQPWDRVLDVVLVLWIVFALLDVIV